MGQTLSAPITAKNTASCQDETYRVASSSMQGWRIHMEDAHTHILSLPDDPPAAFFAVYDGHGGAKVSEFASRHLHRCVAARKEYRDGDVAEALRAGFLDMDKAMLEEEALKHEQSGSTAVTVLVRGARLWCANVGDSRAVASVGGRAVALSHDHKPNNKEEYERIVAAGGWVDFNRVNGNLALSRALGDFIFKRNDDKPPQEQVVTAYPEVLSFEVTPEWEFVVLACDGIWDVMTSMEVIGFVRERIATGMEFEEICEDLMMYCLAPDCQLAGLGCDNMTVVIVGLLRGGSYAELCAKCAKGASPAEGGAPETAA